MSSKEQAHRSDKAGSKGQSSKKIVDKPETPLGQTHPASLLQQARLEPGALTPRAVLQMQRTIGNQAMQQLLVQQGQDQITTAQPALTVGPAGETDGQAADRLALPGLSQSSQPTRAVQRAPLEEEKDLQLKPLKDSIQPISQEIVQAFWIKEGDKEPRWEDNESQRKNYLKTKETWWTIWHWPASPIFVPPTPVAIVRNAIEEKQIDFAAMMKLCTEQNVPFKTQMQFAIEYYHATVTIDLLRPYLEQVSQTERDKVWQDKTLMTAAKTKLSLDTYLALLPALRVFNQPTTTISEAQGKWVSHMRGDEADKYIRAQLGPLVAGAVKAGRQVEGEVSVVNDTEWVIAFKRQWGEKISPDVANAFVDVSLSKRHIWIHKDRGNAGTVVHEGMHKYAAATLRDELIHKYPGSMPISQLDEGITEYFTREVINSLGIVRENYADPFLVAEQLVTLVGRDTVAKAYFDGDFESLKQAYITKKSGKTMTDWEAFARAIEEKRFSDASSYL